MHHSQLSDGSDRFDRRAFCKAAGVATAVGVVEASLEACWPRQTSPRPSRNVLLWARINIDFSNLDFGR